MGVYEPGHDDGPGNGTLVVVVVGGRVELDISGAIACKHLVGWDRIGLDGIQAKGNGDRMSYMRKRREGRVDRG
jgi:hypothetical protein